MIAVIDCGTTNTRVYILDGNKNIIGQSSKKVGVRDTAISGSNKILSEGIKDAFIEAVKDANIDLPQIEFAIASGMITSEIGLIDIPHLIAPIGALDLAKNVKVVHDMEVFPLDMPVLFVRGIKNNYGANAFLSDIRKVDFMRGEEVQVVGLLSYLKPKLPLNVVFLSSHTKLIHVNENGQIEGSITTISGQFYEALKETSIAKCIRDSGDGSKLTNYSFEEIVSAALDSVANSGLLRTMLMPRFMQNLMTTNWIERQLFVDAAIAAEDMMIFDEFGRMGYKTDTDYIFIGHKERCEIYELMLKNKLSREYSVSSIYDKDEIDLLTVKGAAEVAELYRNIK